MARMRLTTYQDCIDHLLDYLGGASDDNSVRYARRAIQDAYNSLPGIHSWSYLYTRGRVSTSAPQSTGTIAYNNSSLTVTLTGATWPSWVTQGVLVINNVPYPIATNPTSTTITLPPTNNPGADVSGGATYTLYQDAYSLPIDFTQTDEMTIQNYGIRLSFEHPQQWLSMQRIYRGPATPRVYSIIGSSAYFGAMSLRMFPPPDAAYQIDFMYKRRPRPLSIYQYTTGTCSLSTSSTTVTGSGTSFDSSMVGSSIRFSAYGDTVAPTGPSGEEPFFLERTILAVTDTQTITIDAVPGVTLTGLAFAISDPLDIEEGAMLSFFLRLCEKHMRLCRRIKSQDDEMKLYQEAMDMAMEADNRSTQRQVVGNAGYPRRLRDFPAGGDQG